MSEGQVSHRLRPARALILAGVLACGLAASIWLASQGVGSLPVRCVLHDVTGLHCPGCGMTRATYAAMHGEFGRAFRFNPLGVLLLPVALLAMAPGVWRWLHDLPPRPERRWARLGAILAGLVIAFGILRNLPWKPFLWLAPPAEPVSTSEQFGNVFGQKVGLKIDALANLAGGEVGGLVGVRDDPEAGQGVVDAGDG